MDLLDLSSSQDDSGDIGEETVNEAKKVVERDRQPENKEYVC